MEGWIKLHRKILNSDMYRNLNSKQRDVMITLLLMANHKTKRWEHDGKIYEAKPGQMVTSLKSIQENCASDVSIQNIRTALDKLKSWGFLTWESTNKNRLVTIINWAVYQGDEDDANKQSNNQLTSHQQTTNNQLTTNKNDKNDKEMMIDDDRLITPLPHPEEKIGPNWETSWRVGEYFSQRCGRGLHVRESDRFEIEQLLDKGVTEREILFWIDECFKRKKGSTINSFRYIATVIEDERRKREQQKSNKVTPLRRRNQPKENFSDLPKAIRRQMEREARGETLETKEDPKLKAEIMEELNRMRRRFEEKRAGGQ